MRAPHRGKTSAFVVLVLLAGALSGACGGEPQATDRPEGDASLGFAAPEYSAAIESARGVLGAVMEEEAIPGLSVAVGRGTEILWSEGFGYSDLTHQVKVTPLTKFRVGSVSKPITAAALALLVEAGALDLDAPVQTYVPSFPEKIWPVTTRQLAGHLGGIRHYLGMENFSSVNYPDVRSGLEIFKDDPLINEPGTEFSYSSYGWNLISSVIEGAAGEPFLEYMHREVFDALGMENTIADYNQPVIPHRTRFYARGMGGQVVNAPYVDNSYKWAGGGFLSTPEDLLIFANAHAAPGYLEAGTLELLFTSQTLRDGSETGYGIGWRSATNDHGEMVVSHTGGSVGGRTVMTLNRENGLIVAIVANLSSAPMSNGLAGRIEELFR
ncbi:MAG: serine hydrolase [Gemmatimonadota bacterium]|nr:serine hydrolase [Gemmatimonadota bacterium]MDE2866269.1 serine hydrolase [Gemmatimonadota bacterium]